MSQSDPQSPPGSPIRTPDSPDRALSTANSVNTDATDLSDFYAAVASTPPCVDDWIAYPYDLTEAAPREARDKHFPSEALPSADVLARAAQMPLFDRTGSELSFGSLYQGRQYIGQQRLIIFIRHFYCRACKGFVRHLRQYFAAAAARTQTHSIEKSIVLIGCGHPALIDEYTRSTECPYPIYTDPTQKLVRLMGCSKWAGMLPGPRADYTKENGNALNAIVTSVMDNARAFKPSCPADCDKLHAGADNNGQAACSANGKPLRKRISKDGLRGGPWLQIGGEFLFENGELVWAHRMRSSRGHMAPNMLRKVLDPADVGPPPPEKEEHQAKSGTSSSSTITPGSDPSRLGSSKSAQSTGSSKQAWSKAEFTLMPGSHIVQQASAPSSNADPDDDESRLRPSPSIKDFPRSRLSPRYGTIPEAAAS